MTTDSPPTMMPRLSRGTLWALGVAIVWGTGLAIAAAIVPAYGSESWSSGTPTSPGEGATAVLTKTSRTLINENGLKVLLAVCAPLAVVCLVAFLLWWEVRGHHGAVVVAWILAGLLGVFNLLAMLTIGIFVVPITVAVFVACGITQSDQTTRRMSARWAMPPPPPPSPSTSRPR